MPSPETAAATRCPQCALILSGLEHLHEGWLASVRDLQHAAEFGASDVEYVIREDYMYQARLACELGRSAFERHRSRGHRSAEPVRKAIAC